MHKALKSLCLLFSSWACKSNTYLLNEARLAHPPALSCSNSIPSCASLFLPLIVLAHIFQSRQSEGCCQKTGRMVSTAHKAETLLWIREKEAPSRLSGSLISTGRASVHDIHVWWWVSCSPFLSGMLLPVVHLQACCKDRAAHICELWGEKKTPFFCEEESNKECYWVWSEWAWILICLLHITLCCVFYYLCIVCNLKKQKWSKPQGAAFFSTFSKTQINSN